MADEEIDATGHDSILETTLETTLDGSLHDVLADVTKEHGEDEAVDDPVMALSFLFVIFDKLECLQCVINIAAHESIKYITMQKYEDLIAVLCPGLTALLNTDESMPFPPKLGTLSLFHVPVYLLISNF